MTTTLGQAAPPLETSTRGRRLLTPIVSAVGAAAFFTVAHVVDPNEPGNYPTCPWLALTGTFCAGCGTLRATHALTHGDVGGAVARNPLTVVAYVVIFFGFLNFTVRMWSGRPKARLAPAWVLYGMLGVILGYWVLRNVPGWTFLSPL